MSVRAACRGCGEKRLLFEPERRCLDCRDGGVQLALALDVDDMDRGAFEAVEAAVLEEEADRAREASWSRTCRCSSPVVDDESCLLCGHEPAEAVAA